MFMPMAEYFTIEEAKLSQWEALIKIEIDKIFKKNQPDVCLNWQAEFECRVWTAGLKGWRL